MLDQSEEINNLQNLMKLQNKYIQELNKLIYVVFIDIALANNHDFAEFVSHFSEFIHYHYKSEGYSQAAQLVQTYRCVLFERLLNSQILAAAEQMELAINYLEMAVRETKARFNPQIILINQAIMLIEETQLKIIESLEAILGNFHSDLPLLN